MTRWPSISADVTIASAFVARCCSAQRPEIVNGVYRLRDDEPTRRISADQGDFDEARSEAPGKSGLGCTSSVSVYIRAQMGPNPESLLIARLWPIKRSTGSALSDTV
jgi:hypothetical protein